MIPDLPNLSPDALRQPSLPLVPRAGHPPRILLLYGSLRQRSYSRFATLEAERLLRHFGCETHVRTAVRNYATEAAAWSCCGRRKSRPPFPFLRQQGGREDFQRGTISQGSTGLRGGHEPASGGDGIQHIAARHGREDDDVLGAAGLPADGRGQAAEA